MTNRRRLSLPLLLISAFQLFSVSAFSQPISTAEAKANVGQEKTVNGTVMKISPVGKLTILDIDGVFPNAPFSAVIFGDKLPLFDKATLDSYKGKPVAITGKISLHKDKPQIVLNDPSQITLAEAGAAATPAPAETTPPSPASPATDNNQPATTPAPAAPTPTPGKGNLLSNGNWNKGKKDWDIPSDAEVVTEGSSQVLKILLKPEAVVVQQEIKKFPKDVKQAQLSFDVKLADGAKLTHGIKLTLGSSVKDGSHFSPKLTGAPNAWQEVKWSAKVNASDTLTLFLEIGPGEGTLFLDNFQLLP